MQRSDVDVWPEGRDRRSTMDLTAALVCRERLARVEAFAGPEGPLELRHRRHVRLGEDQRHVVALLDTDAVLPGDRSARLNANAQDLPAGVEHLRGRAGHALVEHDVGVEVAVAGMEDIA